MNTTRRYQLPAGAWEALGVAEIDADERVAGGTYRYVLTAAPHLTITMPGGQRLEPVRPPLPPEPPDGTRWLAGTGAVWSRHDDWASSRDEHRWFSDGGGGIFTWADVVDKAGPLTPLVPDPLVDGPARLPWSGRVAGDTEVAVNRLGPDVWAAVNGLERRLQPAEARQIALALLRAEREASS